MAALAERAPRALPAPRGAPAPRVSRTPRDESVSLWFRLLSCHARMLAELRRELEAHVTMPRFDLLASLLRSDGQTLAALSRDLLVTAGNVTGLVDRAERDGLVLRKADPADRRVARVWLTPEGRALIRELLPAHDAQVHALLAGIPAAQRRDLRRLLGALRDHLSKDPCSKDTKGKKTRP
jgi:DNA-binding MarR family transcriptional regulator